MESGKDLRLLAVNGAWEALMGLPESEIVGRTMEALFPDREDSWIDWFRQVAVTGEAVEGRVFLPEAGRWAQVRLQQPEPGKVLVLLRAPGKVEEPGQRRELLALAAERSPSCIFVTDPQGKIQLVNEAFEVVTGYTQEEVVGLTPRVLKSGQQSDELYQELWQTLTQGRPWMGELQNRRKDGSFNWVRASLFPRLEEGRIINFLAIEEDISKEKSLRLGGERLLAALERMEEAVATVSGEGKITYANPRFSQLTGCQGIGAPDEGGSASLPELLGQVGVRMLRPLPDGSKRHERFPFVKVDGTPLVIDGICSRVSRGADLDWVVVLRDVTSEIEKERDSRQAEKMEALSAMASGIAHDFNNVLTVILSAAELIEWQAPEGSPIKAKVNAIKLASQRAKELNRRILTYGQKDGEVRIPFDFTSLVREVLFLLRSAVPAGVELKSNLASSIWTVGDSNQIHQVVMNLAVNGFQAMENHGGVLEMTLEEVALGPEELPAGLAPGRYSLLTVTDQGCGMSEDVKARAMEPFFSTKKQEGGSGMGLFGVHNIVASHRGFIRVDSQVDEGTSFRVYLPCAEVEAGAAGLGESTEPVGGEALLVLGGDDLEIALMTEGLKQLGYQVARMPITEDTFQTLGDHASTARAIILRATKRDIPVDACIHRLRKVAGHLPIILVVEPTLSALSSGETKADYDDFVMKPATPADVARVVRRVLAGWNPAEHPGPTPGTQGIRHWDKGLPTILLAEDSPSTRGILRSWLVKAGYAVLATKDGQEAWERFQQADDREIDLVLTDIVMPVMDGLELVNRIRNIAPEVPIVILSSVEDAEAHKKALHMRVNAFLEKPFSSEVLLERIKYLIDEHEAMHKARRSTDTVQSVRMAQRAMVDVPEMDLPIFTLSEPLSDAGGDVFRSFRQKDGTLVFVLADVAGHSVLSSYAVASFLGMLSSYLSEEPGLRMLAERLNTVVQTGPFSEIPICALFGHWDPALGRLHVLNAGIPYGMHFEPGAQRVQDIQINGTPLGLFAELNSEERVLWLREGDRILFATDGIFESASPEGECFGARAANTWRDLGLVPVKDALGSFCSAALGFAHGKQTDDVLAVAFEQGPIQDGCALHLHVPSTPQAIDAACARVSLLLDGIGETQPIPKERSFNLLVALREAMTNALFHGNRGRQDAQIFLRCEVSADSRQLRLTVADEGLGFVQAEQDSFKDPLSEGGRGLTLIRAFAESVSMTAGELCLQFELARPASSG